MLVRFFVFAGVFSVASVWAQDGDYGHWADYVPGSGSAKAQIMILDSPKDVQEISEKIEAAQKADPEFFSEHQAKTEPGDVMPYDPRLGITEAEYQRLLTGAAQLQMHPAGEAEIRFSVNELGVAQVSGLPINSPYGVLKYDIELSTVSTPYGDLTSLARVAQNDASGPTGTWDGLQWTLSDPEVDGKYAFISFAIGRFREQPKNMIYYDVNAASGAQVHEYHFILIYDADQ